MLSEPHCRLRYAVVGDEAGVRDVALVAGTIAKPRSAEGLIAALAFETDSLAESQPADDGSAQTPAAATTLEQIDGGTYRLILTAYRPLTIDSCEVTFKHTFTDAERVFMNGYQSWTDSWELPTDSRMRGLALAPRVIIDHYALDGSGDYRFTSYPDRPGELHGYGYMYLRENPARRGDRFTLVASLSEDNGFTLLRTSRENGTVTISKERVCRTLQTDESCTLCSFAVLEGSKQEVFDRWFALMGSTPRAAKPLIGYTSWYRHYADIDAATLEGDLRSDATALGKVFDVAGGLSGDSVSVTFQIDDGYTKVGDWLSVDQAKFPAGLKPLASAIASTRAGTTGPLLIPGLWLAPFICEKDSRLFQEHADWLLHDENGRLVTVGSNWSGGYALDTRNSKVRSYVGDVLRTVTGDWGFKLLKLDFLFAACMVPHDELNRGQLMADAMDLLRSNVAEDTMFLCCGVPLNSVFGRTEYCRIGCDVGPDWDDKPYMRFLHRERTSTKNNLGDTIGRAPLDGRAFLSDPDVFYLRDDVKLTIQQRKEQLSTDARCGSVLLTSDDMSLWSDDDMALYREALEDMLRK